MDYCLQHQIAEKESQRIYTGDMAACDAVQELMK